MSEIALVTVVQQFDWDSTYAANKILIQLRGEQYFVWYDWYANPILPKIGSVITLSYSGYGSSLNFHKLINTEIGKETPVLRFKKYDGMKVFVLFIFLLALLNFLVNLTPHQTWWHAIPFIGFTVEFANFCWRFLILTFSYCLLWLTFDPKVFYEYVMAVFTVIFGIVYIISPSDFAPDVFPVIGGIDDAAIGGLSMLLGMKNWFRAQEQDKNQALVINALQKGDREMALKLLLQDRGVNLK